MAVVEGFLHTYGPCENTKEGIKETNLLLARIVATGQLAFLKYTPTKNCTTRLVYFSGIL